MKNYLDGTKKKLEKLEAKGKLTVEKMTKLYEKQLYLTEKSCKKWLRKIEKITDDVTLKIVVLKVQLNTLENYIKTGFEIDDAQKEKEALNDEEEIKGYEMAIHYMMRQRELMKYVLDKCSEIIEKEPEYMVV